MAELERKARSQKNADVFLSMMLCIFLLTCLMSIKSDLEPLHNQSPLMTETVITTLLCDHYFHKDVIKNDKQEVFFLVRISFGVHISTSLHVSISLIT